MTTKKTTKKAPAKKGKAKAAAPETTALAPVAPAPVAEAEEAKEPAWEWTPERERALKMVEAGLPNGQIATELGVHRNTVANWKNHPEFKLRLRELQNEHVETVRTRRHRETNIMTDKVAQMVNKRLDDAIANPNDDTKLRRARDWMSEYRAMRNEERIDVGDNVVNFKHSHEGQVDHNHTHVAQKSFKGFMTEAMKAGAIDAEAVEVKDGGAHDIIVAITQQALLETSLLDDIAEEEKRAAMNLDAHTAQEKR